MKVAAEGERGRRPMVLVVDDHVVLADGLVAAFATLGFVASATTADPPGVLAEVLERERPDVVVLDLWLGEVVGSGLALIPQILAAGARVVVLTASDDTVLLASCLEAGAHDLAGKTEPFDSILRKVRSAIGGGRGIDPAIRAELLTGLRRSRAADATRLYAFDRLTPREADVLRALIGGRSAQQIADSVPVSLATVRTQIRNILGKLGVTSQLAAVALAHRAGWATGADDTPGIIKLDDAGKPAV